MIERTRTVLAPALAAYLMFGVASAPAQVARNEESARTMRLERLVLPEFPSFLRQTGVLQGTVVVALGHDGPGPATDVLVLESTDSRFTDAALEAIREWRFEASPPAAAPAEPVVPVVRFLFSTGAVSVVPLSVGPRGVSSRQTVRANTPVELPNFSHLDHEPRALHQPVPEFPAPLRGRIASGTVVVKYFVDTTGRTRLPVVITATAPEFGAAAISAVRQWRFEPPRMDGKPVVAIERHSFVFGQPKTN